MLLALSMMTGCSTFGPKLYQSSFEDYNDAIRKTADGQMLLNLIRLRYFDTPVLPQRTSVTVGFGLSIER